MQMGIDAKIQMDKIIDISGQAVPGQAGGGSFL